MIAQEAEQLIKDRPSSIDDDLYNWAIDAELMMERLVDEIERLTDTMMEMRYD